jgi:hypothetical protein
MYILLLLENILLKTPELELTELTLGGGIVADRHGVRRAPFRISFGRFSCFR